MPWFRPDQSPQLFGQLLVQNRLVTEDQLARAIAQQRSTGQRLGDILTEWHLLTQQNVQEMLRKQRHLRMAAAFIGALLAPLEFYATEASAEPVAIAAQPVDDAKLSGVTGQGLRGDMAREVRQQLHRNGVEVVGDLATLLDPVLGIVESDFTPDMAPVAPGRASAMSNADGTISLSLPFTAGELSVRNVRVQGNNTTMQAIDLTTTVTYVKH